MFLFNDTASSASPAYLIIPTEHHSFWEGAAGIMPETIHHQYGCVCCRQFEIEGRVEPIVQNAREIADEIGCGGEKRADVVAELFGAPVDDVIDEALVRLVDGRFIASNNCD